MVKSQCWSLVLSVFVSTMFLCGCTASWAANATPKPAPTAENLAALAPAPITTVSPLASPAGVIEPTATTLATATLELSLQIDYPLALHNRWVYKVTLYDGVPITEIMTTTLVLTETVVEAKRIPPYFIAQVHQDESAETPVVVPPGRQGEPMRPATSRDYWLIADRNRLYRQETNLDVGTLGSTALLEFLFPLKLGEEWYQSDEKARLHPTPIPDDFMLRQVTKVGDVIVPAGHFGNCFFLQEVWAGTSFETWFCPNVGIVEQKVDHQGTPEGNHSVLLNYHINQ